MKGLSVLLFSIITIADIYNIIMNVLFDNIPWTTTKSEAFSLSYCMKPKTFVFA